MSEEQVLEHEVVPASQDLAEGREEEADKFEHLHRFIDPAARVLRPYSLVKYGHPFAYLLVALVCGHEAVEAATPSRISPVRRSMDDSAFVRWPSVKF